MGPLNKYSTAGLLIFNIIVTIWIGASTRSEFDQRLTNIEVKVSACK